jgi:2-keto-3-deoxy-L-rhamnonate aldolase RhmA
VAGQVEHARVQEFLERFPRRVRGAGKTAGISVGSAEAARQCYCQGYRFINIGSLLFSGARGLADDLKTLRSLES